MNNLNLFQELEKLLRDEVRYCTDDGILLKNAIVEDALALRPELIRLLLTHEGLKRNFFSELDGILVFDKVKFQKFVMNKRFLPDSYTSYKNKIGLTTDEGDYIADSREVVLSWPYKDCILEGGQTKEDAKRNEVFFNEILAPDEIDRLTEPKVLTKFERYTSDGSTVCTEINPLTDNLLIKGNNLLVLYSLIGAFRRKVKLICIDPPYYFSKDKSGDTFCYNSNFKLSTWLTFMSNRLKAAKELLMPGGIILCHIKEDSIHWLKVLMEEIFTPQNFVETFIWQNTDNPDSLSKKSRQGVEYVVCFEIPKNSGAEYIGKPTENGDAPLLNAGNSVHELVFPAGSISFNIPDGIYPIGKPDRVEILQPIFVQGGRNVEEVHLSGEFKWGQQFLDEEVAKGTTFLVKSDKFSVRFQRLEGTHMAPEKYFDSQYLSKAIGVGTNEDASSHLRSMEVKFTNSKPESVPAFFIKAMTKPGDIVCDFFIGSGTTAAAALKLGRRFIAADQMDYIHTETCKRLKKVISGEQGGISKAVNWQGGGSFVYCELAKANERFVEEIEAATGDEELGRIWNEMQETGFLSWKVEPKTIDVNSQDFRDLSLDDKKRFLIECLDKNMLYIPLSEIDSAEFSVSEEDKKLNRQFYSKN